MNQLEAAMELFEFGLNVLPAKVGGKSPSVPWKEYQHKRTTAAQTQRWFGNGQVNLWVACGLVSHLAVLDCDSDRSRAWWRSRIGAAMDTTACVKTARGAHYWFGITEGGWPSWSRHGGGLDFEVRAEGGGVIAPPSRHESGAVYAWLRGLDHLQPAPKALREPQHEERRAPGLASLLAGAPDDPRKGNAWMTQVLGHFVRQGFAGDDLAAIARAVQQSLNEPLSKDDLDKMLAQTASWSGGFEQRVAVELETQRVREEARRRLRSGGWSEPLRLDMTLTVDEPEPEHLGVCGWLLAARLVWLFGEPETGKSVEASDAGVRELRAGRAVVHLDAEAGEADVRQKYRALGATPEESERLYVYDVSGVDLLQNPGWPMALCREVIAWTVERGHKAPGHRHVIRTGVRAIVSA